MSQEIWVTITAASGLFLLISAWSGLLLEQLLGTTTTEVLTLGGVALFVVSLVGLAVVFLLLRWRNRR